MRCDRISTAPHRAPNTLSPSVNRMLNIWCCFKFSSFVFSPHVAEIMATAQPPVENCPDKLFTWEEIRKHNSEQSCWVVLYGYVCDMTDFLPQHPGGLNPIRDMGGYDTTKTFEAIAAHAGKDRPQKAWRSRVIGRVDPDSKPPVVVRKQVAEKMPVKYSTWGPLLKVIIPVVAAIVVIQWLTSS